MSDGILSDLLGERVRIEQRREGSAFWSDDHGSDTIEGVVRAIVHPPLALIVETDEHVIAARSLMANKITRLARESSSNASWDAGWDFTNESFDQFVKRSGGTPLSEQIARLKAGLTDRELQILEKRFKPKSTVRGVRVGDVFKFKKPPPGWTSGNVLVVDKMPGSAAPEGWDYLPIALLDGEIEPLTDEPPTLNES